MRNVIQLSLCFLFLCGMGQRTFAQDSIETPAPEVVRYEYPQTWLDALNRIAERTAEDWRNGDTFAVATTCFRFLNGTLLARQIWNNLTFWQWTAASLLLMVLGQWVVLGFMGHAVRVMALTFPRRPVEPLLTGVGAVLFGIPAILALFVSIIGVPVAFVVWCVLVVAAIIGKMGIFLSIGWGLAHAFGGRGSSLLPLFIVYGMYATVVLVDPFAVGRALSLVANILGIGLALWTRFGFGVEPPCAGNSELR